MSTAPNNTMIIQRNNSDPPHLPATTGIRSYTPLSGSVQAVVSLLRVESNEHPTSDASQKSSSTERRDDVKSCSFEDSRGIHRRRQFAKIALQLDQASTTTQASRCRHHVTWTNGRQHRGVHHNIDVFKPKFTTAPHECRHKKLKVERTVLVNEKQGATCLSTARGNSPCVLAISNVAREGTTDIPCSLQYTHMSMA